MIQTLLQIVQQILGAMDSDEVNSITDTPEAQQVATIVQQCFYDMSVEIGPPSEGSLIELQASGDATKPVLMTTPSNVLQIDWIKYDNVDPTKGEVNANYLDVNYMSLGDFLVRQLGLRNGTSGVAQMSFQVAGVTYKTMYRTDRWPLYFTYFDDNTVLFDAVNLAVDTTLQTSKTFCMGSVYPIFTIADSFIPPLEAQQFSLLINKAKVRAFQELKQSNNPEATSEARRQKIVTQKRKRRLPDMPEVFKVARYGRKDGTASYSSNLLEKYGRDGT